MKRLITSLFLCLIGLCSFGQKIRFTDTSNVWTYHLFSSGPIVAYATKYIVSYNGDSVVHGTQYHKLYDPQLSSHPWPILVREDTVLQKVFAIKVFHDTDTTEKLLYDYTLAVGDTFVMSGKKYHVQKIDTISIGSTPYRMWYLNPDNNSLISVYDITFAIIEGIGCVKFPSATLDPRNPIETRYMVNCFRNNGIQPAVSPAVGPFYEDISPTLLYFDNNASCDYVFMGVKEESKEADLVTIFPNPATEFLTINCREKISSVQITEMTGRTVYQHKCNSEHIKIDVSHIPSGVYLIRVNDVVVRRFLKN